MAKAKATQPPAATSGRPLEGFLTDQQLAVLGLGPDTAASVLQDAGPVYAQITKSPYMTHGELVEWATSTWPAESSPVDRLNAVIEFLQASKRITPVGAG
jgi:hypothetical protein